MHLPVPGFEPTSYCVPRRVCYPLGQSGRCSTSVLINYSPQKQDGESGSVFITSLITESLT